MGGPATLEDIRPFLYKLFNDKDMIRLPFFMKPFQSVFAYLVAKFRTPGTTEMYRQIGDGSPILGITTDLAKKIQKEVNELGYQSITTIAMRYTYPRVPDAVDILKKEKIQQLLLFTQYPHYDKATTGSSYNEFYKSIQGDPYFKDMNITQIDDWGDQDEYIDWWVNGIRNLIKKKQLSNVQLIFTVHGIPQNYVKKGSKYPSRVEACVQEIYERLEDIQDKFTHHLSYQSKAGPLPWTQPYTDDLLEELAAEGHHKVVMVPLGFVSNHVETLYEIDILYKDLADSLGINEYYRVEVPDANDMYAKDMAKMLIRFIGGN